jgi:Na+-transporting NADH:ubiquinone oxidoreductase subunit F
VVKLPEGEDLNFRSGDYIQIDVPKYDVEFGRISM